MAHAFILITLVLSSVLAHAQMDPSTALLLRGSGRAPSLDALGDEVHVAPTARARRTAPRIVITPAPTPVAEPESTPPPAALVPRLDWSREPAAEPPLVTREEILSVRLSAGYLGLSSQSSQTARDYTGGGAGLNLGITLWATPALGVKADYLTTVGADVRGANAHHGLDHQEIDAGVIYRAARVGPRWTFGLGYHQLSNEIARTTAGPVGGRSRGADVSTAFILPTGEAYAHLFEAHLQPYLLHDEIGSADRASSGPAGAAFGGSLAFGGQLELERRRRVFWRVRYTFEHDGFTRSADVDVHQTWLTLGLKWGS